MQHRPRKRFGQNFLEDPLVIDAIIQAINPQKNDRVLEIGPGLGALTRPLLTKLNALLAIEIDTDLVEHLEKLALHHPLTVIKADALQVDFSQWGENLRVVGNLPYNISTPLIFHLLAQKQYFTDMHFMLQKEVVDRLSAKPGCKAYGRLSIMVQVHCAVECLFLVPAKAFKPAPKVESAIVRLVPYTQPKYGLTDALTLNHLVSKAFAMRRKTLANNLKTLLSADVIRELGIDPSLRPEQISIDDYVHMAQFIFNSGKIG